VTHNDLASTFYLLEFERAVDCVVGQTGRSVDDVSDRTIERAHVEQCTLGDLAMAVVEGKVRFDASRDRLGESLAVERDR
jgi:hypothetical protein